MEEHIIQQQQQTLLTPSTFLSYLKANYFLTANSINDNTKQTIQSTIQQLLSQNIPLPYELLFYIYLLTISNEPSYTNALTALSTIRHIEHLSQIISTSLTTSNHISLLPLTKNDILPLFTSTALEHPNETNIYLGLVKLIEFVSSQTQTQQNIITMIPHILQQFKHESLLELQIILIILNYFDNIEQLNDVEMYMLIFEMLIGKFDVKTQRAKDIPLLKWILTKIIVYNIPIGDNNNNIVNALLKQFCIEFRNVLADNDTLFLTNILPKILVRFVNENKIHLLSKYQTLKEGIIDVYYYSKLPTQLKFSVFYYKLLCKIKKREYAKYITLNSNKVNNYIDVYIMFIYMNKYSRGILNNMTPFNEIINKIELNENVDVFQYRNNIYNPNKISFFSTDYHTLNKYVERNVIHYEKVKFSINSGNNELIEYFNALALKNPSQIIFIETYSDNNVDNDIILKHMSITYTPPKEYKVKYFFQFKGLFIVDSNKTKYAFLYEKHSHKWYSPYHKRWEFYIQNLLPNDITTFTFVYYRRQTKLPYIDIYNNHFNINSLPKGNETDCYWKVFTHIATINPLLLKQNMHVYYKLFNLNDINNIKALYAFLESQCDLKHNEHSKHLLLDVVMNKRLSCSNEEAKDDDDEDAVIKEIETKWFVINSNTLLDKVKNYMNRNTSDVYSNNTYDVSLLLWNVYYMYEHICDNVNQRVIPKLLPCYLCLMYMWNKLTNDDDKRFWETALKDVSIAPKFTSDNANSLHNLFPFNNANTINITNIKKYWNNVTLKLIDEYKLKCLSEFMLFYIENANNNVNDRTTLCNNFEMFITNNKLLLSVTNITNEDTKCIIHLIHNYIKLFKKDNTMHIYNDLISKCFNGEDNTIQLTELQKLVVDDYVKELLCKDTKDYPVEKLEHIMRFVLEEERLQEIFITELLRRKDNEDAFHKVVKPILLTINQYIDNDRYINIRYVVVYYMMYCKINKMKKKIESINTNNNIHYIFMKMNKINNVDDVFKDKEGNNNVIMDVSTIENDIKDIETKLNKKIFLFNYIEQHNNINIEGDIPLMIYNYQPLLNSNNTLSTKDKMFYVVHDNKRIDYKLKGIVLKPTDVNDKVKEVVLINNEHNAYWYSLYEKKWMSVVDAYLNNEMYSHIMKVYCLVDKHKKHSNVTFGDLPDEGSNSPYFESNIKIEMKWLLNNAVNDMYNHIKPFYNMFNLQYERCYNEIINIEGVDYNNDKVKDVLNKITHITQYKNLQKIRQLAD